MNVSLSAAPITSPAVRRPAKTKPKAVKKLSKKTRDMLNVPAKRRNAAQAAYEDYLTGDKPAGSYDNASRWLPVQSFSCCDYIRSPSRNWPFTMLKHTTSLAHKEALHGAVHDDVLVLRRWLNEEGLTVGRAGSNDLIEKAIRKAERATLRAVAVAIGSTAPARPRARL